jgi:hypothetical protein
VFLLRGLLSRPSTSGTAMTSNGALLLAVEFFVRRKWQIADVMRCCSGAYMCLQRTGNANTPPDKLGH